MRKIMFDDETISKIKEFIDSGHSIKETSNRFSIKIDTLKRVMKENNIFSDYQKKHPKEFSEDVVSLVCSLYECTETRLHDICKQAGIKYDELKEILNKYYTEEFQNNRKSHLYSLSKIGDKNPMTGKLGEDHHNYKGLVGDGNGYLMCLKPDWYTGRKGSKHVFQHSVVMCENLGITEIPKGFTIHHIDGNKQNNNINNLALITNSGHLRLHAIQKNLCKVQRLANKRSESDKTSNETPDND